MSPYLLRGLQAPVGIFTNRPKAADNISDDPLLAKDGSFLIFTKFGEDWRATCDLYISFRSIEGWGQPQALTELNSEGADFAAALSSNQEWLYYRKNFQFQRVRFKEILERYRG